MKNYWLIIIFFFAYLITNAQQKAPAKPGPIEYKQPDGKTVTIFLKGDEKKHWAETEDGYTLLSTNDGAYVYAIKNPEGKVIPSSQPAHNPKERKKAEKKFIKKIPKKLEY